MTPTEKILRADEFHALAYDSLVHLGGKATPAELLVTMRGSDRASTVKRFAPVLWEWAVLNAAQILREIEEST